jgi:hypothetical protein
MDKETNRWKETQRVVTPKAHASTITGLSLLSFDTFASASIDQRMNLWQITPSKDSGTEKYMTLLESRYTLIADVQCLDVLQRYAHTSFAKSNQAQSLSLIAMAKGISLS